MTHKLNIITLITIIKIHYLNKIGYSKEKNEFYSLVITHYLYHIIMTYVVIK